MHLKAPGAGSCRAAWGRGSAGGRRSQRLQALELLSALGPSGVDTARHPSLRVASPRSGPHAGLPCLHRTGQGRPPGLPVLLPWACSGPCWAREALQLSSDLGFRVWGDDVGNKENLTRTKNSAGSFQNSESLGIGLLLTTCTVYPRPWSTSLPPCPHVGPVIGGRPRGPATAPALCTCPHVCSAWVCASHTEGWFLAHTSLRHGVGVRGVSLHRRGCWFQCPAAVGCQSRGSRNLQPVGPRCWGPWAPVVHETGPMWEMCASGSLGHTVGAVMGPHGVQQRSPVSGARCCAAPTSPRAPASAPCVGTV